MTMMPGPHHPERFFSGHRAILLVLTAVLVLALVSMLSIELFARHRAAGLVADAVQCEVQDSARVSFGTSPPVITQYLRGDYSHIAVQTAGNQVRGAKGMQIDLDIDNIHLNKGADASASKGTIGSLDGTITWSADGIKASIQDVVPVIGNLVTGNVTTNPGDGTIELKGLLDHATVKPQVVDNGLSLQVVSLSALGLGLDTDKVQSNLDSLTDKATKNYPLGVHVDSVAVTDTGVVAKFSSQNATIPANNSNQDSCFSNL